MFYLITFDISDNRDRYRAVKALKGVGIRVQKSVFECADLNEHGLLKVQERLDKVIDHSSDSVRYYHICKNCIKEVEYIGIGSSPSTSVFKVI